MKSIASLPTFPLQEVRPFRYDKYVGTCVPATIESTLNQFKTINDFYRKVDCIWV